MNKGILLAVVATLIMLPPVFALKCDYLTLTERDVCNQIASLPITEQEQESLLSSSLQEDLSIPNHALVYSWNNQINMTNAPENVSTSNNGVIQDAWLRIGDIMPSVIENETLYSDSQGQVQTFYNYTIQLPSGTASGDCKTNYSFKSQTASLKVFLNNISIGQDSLSSFQTNSEDAKNFYSQLDIQVQTKIDHYKDTAFCAKYYSRSKNCKLYSSECRLSNTEIKTDSLTVSDNLTAQSSPHIPVYNFTMLNDYSSVVKGVVTASNYTNFVLSFGDSFYKKKNYVYDYIYSYFPYNVATVRATPQEQESSDNLNINPLNDTSFEFIVKNKSDCQITLFTFFSNTSYQCIPEIIIRNLSIVADKIHYFANETINLDIEPKNLLVNISYGNQTYLAQNSLSLQADTKYGRIDATYQGERSESLVSVTEESHLVLASEILLFIAINYTIFSILTNEAWILKWLTAAS